jgi:hypothetical protein
MTTQVIHTVTLATGDAKKVARFLPSNYEVIGTDADDCVIIRGSDSAGWTLDGYVIPRLASGLIYRKRDVA